MLRLSRHGLPLALVAGDVAAVASAVVLSHALGAFWIGEGAVWPKFLGVSAIVVATLYLADLYRTDLQVSRWEVSARLVLVVAATGVLAAAAGFALPPLRFGRAAFGQILAFLAVGLLGWRLCWLSIRGNARLRQRVLVLGVSDAAPIVTRLQDSGVVPFTVLGFLDDDPGAHDRLPAPAELLGKTRDVLNIAEELQPDIILVALSDMRRSFPLHHLLECRFRGVRVEEWPSFYERQTGRILVSSLRPSWLIFSKGFVNTSLTRALKRAMDLVLALVGLVIALPIMAVVAVAIRLDSPGPTLFRQERVGERGRIFVLKKFRSMNVDAEKLSGAVWASLNDPRVTRVGRFLRRTRLDELPQLLNVLVGEMSFVGPRPERPEFVQMLQARVPFYMERLNVKPGITGWAQVRREYAASLDDAVEKLEYDLYYIKNLSPLLDVLILLGTIQVVLFARGAR